MTIYKTYRSKLYAERHFINAPSIGAAHKKAREFVWGPGISFHVVEATDDEMRALTVNDVIVVREAEQQ